MDPRPARASALALSASAQLDLLPTSLVEAETRFLPMVAVEARLHLPAMLSVHARVAGAVIANEALVGLAFSHALGPFALRLEWASGWSFGFVETTGFDVSAWSYIHRPSFSGSIELERDLRLIASVDATLSSAQRIVLGDTEILGTSNSALASLGFGVLLEHRLIEGAVFYGITALGSVPDHLVWLAFSDAGYRSWFPRLIFGWST